MSEAPILVTGGTGTLGRLVVRRLEARGRTVRVLSRSGGSHRGNLATGEGLAEAVAGVGTVIHCASDPRRPGSDLVAARNLIDALRRAGGGAHLVFISIVGVDRVPYRYYRIKYQVERMIEGSGLPYTILRATQFHDLVLASAQALARLPVVPVPAGTPFQPVDAAEVADRLVALALGGPRGRAGDMGGPEVAGAAELVRAYLAAAGRHRPLLPIRFPGRLARAFRNGAHTVPEHRDGQVTFARFLADRVRPGAIPKGYGAARRP